MFVYISNKSISFFGTSTNLTGTGVYVMLIAIIAMAVGVFLDSKNK